MELRKHIAAADEYFGSDEMKKQLFGKRANEFEYNPCIRMPEKQDDKEDDNDDDDEDKPKKKKPANKKYPPMEYCKMKFNMVTDNKERINKTKLKRIDGKTKNIVIAKTVTDIANEIRFHSEIKFIFYYAKVWKNKTKAKGALKKLYGIGFKIMAIEYTPSLGQGLRAEDIEFRSDDEDDEEENEEKISTNKQKSSSKSVKSVKFDDDDVDDANDANDANNANDDDNELSDKEEEVEAKPTIKNKKKLKKNWKIPIVTMMMMIQSYFRKREKI